MSSSLLLLQDAALYKQIAEKITIDGYCVLENAGLQRLTDCLRAVVNNIPERAFKPASIGRGADNTEAPDIRGDEIRWINGSDPQEQLWLQWMEGLRLSLNRDLFLGLFSYESHFAHYAQGAFYAKHMDAFKGQANRILSTVFYLNNDWKPGDGGELLIYDPHEEGRLITTVNPRAGTLVIFLSEEFPHEVLPALNDRYSVAGWFRVNSSMHDRVDPPR